MDKLCRVCKEDAVIFFGGGEGYCREHALTEKHVSCFYCGKRATAYVESMLEVYVKGIPRDVKYPCCDQHRQEESCEERRKIERERRDLEDG